MSRGNERRCPRCRSVEVSVSDYYTRVARCEECGWLGDEVDTVAVDIGSVMRRSGQLKTEGEKGP